MEAGLSRAVLRLLPTVAKSLEKAYPERPAEAYMGRVFMHSFILSLIFTVLIYYVLRSVRTLSVSVAATQSTTIGFAVLVMLMVMFFMLPRIQMVKRAEEIERHLLFALREVILLVEAGYPIQDALVSVASGGYGELSVELEALARNVESNVPIVECWERARLRSPSAALDRTLDILESASLSGSILDGQLAGHLEVLEEELEARVQSYTRELSLWSLIYLLFAVAIPTIGAVMLLVISSLLSGGVGVGGFLAFVGTTFVVQIVLIGLVKSRRPLGV